MGTEEFDPAYRSALREAWVILGLFTAALSYTILYCWAFGYGRDPETVTFYAGIPDWVFWGVFAPWFVCVLAATWFCFAFMKDEDLEPPEEFMDGAAPEAGGEPLDAP